MYILMCFRAFRLGPVLSSAVVKYVYLRAVLSCRRRKCLLALRERSSIVFACCSLLWFVHVRAELIERELVNPFCLPPLKKISSGRTGTGVNPALVQSAIGLLETSQQV